MLIKLYTSSPSDDKETIFIKIISHLEMNKVKSESFPQLAVEGIGDGIRERVQLNMMLVMNIDITF